MLLRPVRLMLCGAAGAAALMLGGWHRAVAQDGDSGARTAPAVKDSARLIDRYRTWTKVNPKPILMQPAAAEACAPALPSQQASPHLRKYITVYVNGTGKRSMLHQKAAQFPAGTVIVKEKLDRTESKSPELMTVMVKRDRGYNPDAGDWEYLVFDGAGKAVTAEGKLERCQSCHNESPAKQTDHVYRNYYLPDGLKTALK